MRWIKKTNKIEYGGKAKPTQLVKHSQFMVLSEEDAALFARRWEPVDTGNGWPNWGVPLLNTRWAHMTTKVLYIAAAYFVQSQNPKGDVLRPLKDYQIKYHFVICINLNNQIIVIVIETDQYQN